MTPIPDGREIIWRGETEEHSEAIKIVDRHYEVKEDEYYLDDLEDHYIEQNPLAELIHPGDMEDVNDGDDFDSDDSGEYIVDQAGNTIGRR